MKLHFRLFLIVLLSIISGLYVFPWEQFGYTPPSIVRPYKLGLDLHGGVELDYTVDLNGLKSQSGGKDIDKNEVLEGIKSIIEKRVNSLGLAEPTIQTASYGQESHIIVQIPTQDYGNISEEERKQRSEADITRAKETIGKVVKLEFREEKQVISDSDRYERKMIAEKAREEIGSGIPFETVGVKYRDLYENIEYIVLSGAIREELAFSGGENIGLNDLPYLSPVYESTLGSEKVFNSSGEEITSTGEKVYTILRIESMLTGQNFVGTGKAYNYGVILISQQPSQWMAAKTADGRILTDEYLNNASVSFSQAGAPQVQLNFNTEGAKVFAELTKRLIGKPMAIFVGGELITAPIIQSVISEGNAVITGNYTVEEARKLANDITTGIVPAPIYLTSERMIDAKIGSEALSMLMWAGFIGLVAIILFLLFAYRVSGLLAGIALIIYGLLLVAIIKFFGVVLTLASIAGLILSIGLAIDANILIFERMKEDIRRGDSLDRAIHIGFEKSWSAIWDSHITSLTSAIILYVFGIAMIKGFGLMLGLGIILSLFTAMWVSRILLIVVGRYFAHNTKSFIGIVNSRP